MARQTKETNYNGFAIPLQPDTELGLAMLIAESDEGAHEPVAVVATIREARELARNDFRARMRKVENDDEAGICPAVYKVWARGVDGSYRVASVINAPLQ